MELSIADHQPSSNASSGAGGPLHTHRRVIGFGTPLLSTCPRAACSWPGRAVSCLSRTGDVVGSLWSSGPRHPCPAFVRLFGFQPSFVGVISFGGGLCCLLSSDAVQSRRSLLST